MLTEGSNNDKMIKDIYFDSASSAPVDTDALAVFEKISREFYANPSAVHKKGSEAREVLSVSRDILSQKLGCQAKEFYFTPGGTFSNNLAVFGSLGFPYSSSSVKKNIVTCKAEHKSVAEPIKLLERNGVCVRYADISENGILDFDSLERAVDVDTALVSFMHVNNELGFVLPVNDIYGLVKKINPKVVVHCDAVQSFCKLNVNLKADVISVSGHKIGAVRGIGGIVVRSGVKVSPIFYGGGQESQFAPGTENLPAIASFSAAVSNSSEADYQYVLKLSKHMRQRIRGMKYCELIEFKSEISPYIVCFRVPGIYANVLLNALSDMGIYVSVGSSCSSRGEANYSLKALGFSRGYSQEVVRISFCKANTIEEIDSFCRAIEILIKKLVRK